MKEEELYEEYLEWMTDLVEDDGTHGKLLRALYEIPYRFMNPMDGNRAEDGIFLRYRFGYDVGYDDRTIASLLDIRVCSVLEMIVALCIRCDENLADSHYMATPWPVWFWYMMINLGLGDMSDDRYDGRYLEDRISRFLSGDYGKNGAGGLFRLDDCSEDVSKMELWTQACWFFNGVHRLEERSTKGGKEV